MIGRVALFLAFAAISAAASAATVCKDDRRIVGGVDTKIEDHLWQVAISVPFGDGTSEFCGGSLIQEHWILTAAHCFSSKGSSGARVKAGIASPDIGIWAEAQKIFIHEQYNPQTQENDIALIKLNDTLAGDIIPLAQPGIKLKPCEKLEVTGWGAINEKGPLAETLQLAQVPLVDNATCNAKDAYNGAIKPGMMCAGYRAGGIDACQGDSGGPLVLRGNDGPILVGVVSWGEGCARKLRYGVYTRVDVYSDWIANTILANQN